MHTPSARSTSDWLGPLLSLAVLFVLLPSDAMATPSLDADWGASPEEVEESIDGSLDGSDWRTFGRRFRDVRLQGETWQQYFIFYEDGLIATGYHRSESPEVPRGSTISDIVSYDNAYPVVSELKSSFGDPDFVDRRTEVEYSEELGDSALRASRSVEWDLEGERFRWATNDGTVRYTVKYSLKGTRDHDLVRVKPGAEKHVHFFRISRAFRRAGIRVVRQFERKSREMVVAMVTSSGEVVKSRYETEGEELVPVQPEKDQFTVRDCEFRGADCTMTFRTYGGRVYRVDVDLSTSGEMARRERGSLEEAGVRSYKRFRALGKRLRRHFGSPAADTSIDGWKKDDRKRRKVERIPQGMEAFWTVWYDPTHDLLVRHHISGDHSGSSWRIEQRATFRLHSVARAFADENAWEREEAAIKNGNTEESGAAEQTSNEREEAEERQREGNEETSGSEGED